ncbi:MAG: leucine efflux protein LeuE [Burkholderiaceae bacterium]
MGKPASPKMIEIGIQGFWQFVVGTIIVVLLPGPNSLYVLTTAAQKGPSLGWRAAWGIFTGDTLLMVATASGAASLMVLFPLAFEAVKTLGAVYLGWIGLSLCRAGLRQWREAPPMPLPQQAVHQAQSSVAEHSPHAGHGPYWRALALSLTNPKAILFFLAFFTQFVDADAPSPALAYAVLGLVVQACSLAYLWMLIRAGTHLQATFNRHPKWSAVGIVAVSLCFIGFAFHMLT